MDPLTAVSLASNVVQFLDVAARVVSKSSEVYHSSSGVLRENADLESVTTDLKRMADKLKQSRDPGDTDLVKLSSECYDVAEELLVALNKAKVKGANTVFKCLRKALRSVWTKEKMLDIERRLERFRQQMNLGVCDQLRTQITVLSAEQLQGFQKLDQSSQAQLQQFLNALKAREDVFALQLGHQTRTIERLSQGTRHLVLDAIADATQANADLHDETRVELSAAIDIAVVHHNSRAQCTDARVTQQHELTRAEILAVLNSNQASLTEDVSGLQRSIKQLEIEMQRRTEELTDLIRQTHLARRPAERRALAERGSAVTVIIVSMENLATELKLLLGQLLETTRIICNKLKINFETTMVYLSDLSTIQWRPVRPSSEPWVRRFAAGSTYSDTEFIRSKSRLEQAADASEVYYEHVYMVRVTLVVSEVSEVPSALDRKRYSNFESTFTSKNRLNLATLTSSGAGIEIAQVAEIAIRQNDVARFIWIVSSVATLCATWHGNPSLIRMLFAVTFGVLGDYSWSICYTNLPKDKIHLLQGRDHRRPRSLREELQKCFTPPKGPYYNKSDAGRSLLRFDVWNIQGASHANRDRLLGDITAWLSFARTIGLHSLAMDAWKKSVPQCLCNNAALCRSKPSFNLSVPATEPRADIIRSSWRDAWPEISSHLVTLTIFLLAFLKSRSPCRIFANHGSVEPIATCPHFIQINPSLDPGLWVFANALQCMGAPILFITAAEGLPDHAYSHMNCSWTEKW